MSANFWDERFRGEAHHYGREPNDFLRAEAHRLPSGPVLCLAEGEGRNAVFLAKQGHAVTAVDFSREGLRKTETLAREQGVTVHTVLADLGDYVPEPGAFTGIVAIFAHLPPAIRAKVHGWVSTALAPGGVFLLEAYTPAQLALATGGPRDLALLMSLSELERELAPLQIDVGREMTREIQEGPGHSGTSATVQIVATRR